MSHIVIDHIETSLKAALKETDFTQLAVLVDENTRAHCYPLVQAFLPEHLLIQITSGEENKNLRTCEHIWEQFTSNNFDRKALLINLGGGVIGDMGGFCAVTYKRGIRFINIPTTLLAAVDANVGGKLGIDFMGFKNHLGFFQDPETVLIDPIFLKTLVPRELRSGFAEVIKHGLIADADYFEQTTAHGLDIENWEAVIAHSVEIKNEVVKTDPKEAGLRKILINIAKEDFSGIIKLMYQDKKNLNNLLNHSLLMDIGKATYDIAVDEKDVIDSLFYFTKLKH